MQYPMTSLISGAGTMRSPGHLTPELTIEPAGIVLVCPHGSLLAHGAEDGCIRAHEVDVDTSIKLFICRGQRSDRNPHLIPSTHLLQLPAPDLAGSH